MGFTIDQGFYPETDRFGRARFSALTMTDGGIEEVFHFENTAAHPEILVRRNAADGTFMDADDLCYIAQGQRLEEFDTVLEKSFLLNDQFRRHLQNRFRTLMQRPNQPVCRLETIAEKFLAILRTRVLANDRIVPVIDEHTRHHVGIQFDHPAGRIPPYKDIRNNRLGHIMIEFRCRPWVELLDLGNHLQQVFIVDAAEFA